MRAAPPLLLVCWLGALPARAQPEERVRPTPATLEAWGRAVVVSGERLAPLLGVGPGQLWLGAWREGALRPIPFQVDERVPGGDYAWSEGDERKSDVDGGRLDEDDELVFYARDAGDRRPIEAAPPGPAAVHELELFDPARGGKAWVYLLVFAPGEAPPPASSEDRASIVVRDGEQVGLTGTRLQLVGAPGGDNLLHLQELHLREASQGAPWGPDILDRLKLQLTASYLFTGIERSQDEVRGGLRAWRDGPVRVVARGSLETYLIWGHWLRSVPGGARLVMWEDRLELSCAVRLPVDLELDARSELRLSFDLSPEVPELRFWTDTHPDRLRPGQAPPRALRGAAPRWVAIGNPGGTLVARLEPGDSLRRAGNALFVRDDQSPDPPEDFPGSHGNLGWTLDLTGLRSGVHQLGLELLATPPARDGSETAAHLAAIGAPLQVTLR